jgi:hypothetical protein
MEVHHHPQIEKKNFREYFLEFIMIFLAVTMGFFAESLRENITNKEHVKQLSLQLIEDLENDTLSLGKLTLKETRQTKIADTLFFYLQQPLGKADFKKIQKLILALDDIGLFHASSGAMAAIKKQMELKQFASSKIASHIADYETDIAYLKSNEDLDMAYLKEYLETFITAHFTPDNLNSVINKKDILNSEMRDITQKDLTQLCVDVLLIKAFDMQIVSYYSRVKNNAIGFIDYVNKEFHLGKKPTFSKGVNL